MFVNLNTNLYTYIINIIVRKRNCSLICMNSANDILVFKYRILAEPVTNNLCKMYVWHGIFFINSIQCPE